MSLALTPEETRLLAGDQGEGMALAMRIITETARLMGAARLVPVVSAHIDGALYHGDSGTLFAEHLVRLGAKLAIPTTLNVGALDLACGAKTRLPPHQHDMAYRMMRAYEAMGCAPTWTCAPYQAGHRPALGSDVAWGESNAVAFCNSVLGARTNRYGDFLDICCAMTARAPYYGLHIPENRRAVFALDCSGLSPALRNSDVFWPVIGTLFGQRAGTDIGVVIGLEGCATEDRLKAFGAAAASAGAVGLFHILGATPEAPDLATVTGGESIPVVPVNAAMLNAARAGLSTTGETAIDAVAIGSPHCSAEELLELDRLIAGRRLARPFYACTGRHAVAELEAAGRRRALEAAGVTLVADTCVVVTPILDGVKGVLMTNSGKFAHYAPGNTGYAVQYGAMAECVESAVSGRLVREERLWS
ncbi:aconitase X catalytic domain-containing protein [Rhabdaerophilum sp. SD176]|uniref:aconitase X catalytic domain-containing protein n=1 Tax=Rhabdaerophilum sp. SD176 TaxID=2983548 RepID=UPI0024DF7A2F|nr:aconitase X catalytic domain-containing protein [Rhabdaerophilum sp. SD176]